MKCSNCDRDAFYLYQITKEVEVPYCSIHLPGFLEPRRKAGLIKTTEQLTAARESAITTLATEQAPAPKPKRKKKAAEEPSEE